MNERRYEWSDTRMERDEENGLKRFINILESGKGFIANDENSHFIMNSHNSLIFLSDKETNQLKDIGFDVFKVESSIRDQYRNPFTNGLSTFNELLLIINRTRKLKILNSD